MILRISIAVLALMPALSAQTALDDWAANQVLGNTPRGSILETLNQPFAGRPFSAKATVRLFHTLEDGTRIDTTATTLLYRDAAGRRRTEADGIIDISDPVGTHTGIRLNPATMTAQKRDDTYVAPDPPTGPSLAARSVVKGKKRPNPMAPAQQPGPPMQVVTLDLGTHSINGISAHGTRTTLTIPVGGIGNDRDIHVTKETWMSNDLRILVKGSNSDPRFGTSTFELTDIVPGAPNPTLFDTQVPPGYSVRQLQIATFK
jgi:hypothetical protein